MRQYVKSLDFNREEKAYFLIPCACKVVFGSVCLVVVGYGMMMIEVLCFEGLFTFAGER